MQVYTGATTNTEEPKYRVISPSKTKQVSSSELSAGAQKLLSIIKNNDVLKRFVLYNDIFDTLDTDGYLRASIEVISNSGVGAGWEISKHPRFFLDAEEDNKEDLLEFYGYSSPEWNNIKDFYGMPSKISAALLYLKFFGQAAFLVLKDDDDNPLGLEFIYGFVVPNVDEEGNFKSPAFYQMSLKTGKTVAEFSQDEIVYIVRPDIRGKPFGDILIEPLTKFALPLDIYLQSAALSYLRQSKMPPAIWQLPDKIDEEEFNEVADYIEQQYRGVENIGKVPIVISGEIDIKSLSSFPDAIPYQEARKETREEIFSVIGAHSRKLGLTEEGPSSEDRKEFFETTMLPLFEFIEDGFYNQIHKRLLDIDDWEFTFGKLDFLDAVEQATVYMRLRQIGAMNANEIRSDLGLPPREDGGGDRFVDPDDYNRGDEEPGSPPEGRPDDPGAPDEVGEPPESDQDPPRGDRRVVQLIDELSSFQRFILNRWGTKKASYVDFFWNVKDEKVKERVKEILSETEDKNEFIEKMEELRRKIFIGEI